MGLQVGQDGHARVHISAIERVCIDPLQVLCFTTR